MKANEMAGVILAGGNSSRMGQNKLFLSLAGKPVIGYVIDRAITLFAETIVVANDQAAFSTFPVRVTGDVILCAQKNSLTGIHAGLSAASREYCFVLAGDMPFVKTELIEAFCTYADGNDVTIIREGRHFQPLCAIYHKNCLPHIENLLKQDHFKILDFFPHVKVRYVDIEELTPYDPERVSFFNINTPDEFRFAEKIATDLHKKRGDHMTIPVVSIVGKSDSGKTTLICGLLPELKRRGYKVATIKHDVHGFDIDKPGKDTWKHAQAGADTVIISSPWKVAMIEKVDEELTLDQVIAKVDGVDLILTEGFKRNNKPKIEIFRSTVHDQPLCTKEDNLLAIASDIQLQLGVPHFGTNDYSSLTDLIEETFLKKR